MRYIPHPCKKYKYVHINSIKIDLLTILESCKNQVDRTNGQSLDVLLNKKDRSHICMIRPRRSILLKDKLKLLKDKLE